MRQRINELVRSGGVAARKEKLLSVDAFVFIAISMRFLLATVFFVIAYDMIYLVSVSVWGSRVVLGNFSCSFRDDFLTFRLACPEAKDPIYTMSCIGEIFILKGFSIDLRPDNMFPSFSLLVRVTCLGGGIHLDHVKLVLTNL